MKKIILFTLTLLGLFISVLQAEEKQDYALVTIYDMNGESFLHESNRTKTLFKDINVNFKLLKSNNSTITIDNIKQYDNKFVTVTKEETFQDTNTTYWLRVNLGDNFPSGRFVYTYGDAGFSAHTIKDSQALEKFKLENIHHMKFSYDAKKNAQIYYFKLIPKHYRIPFRFLYVSTPDTFYTYMARNSKMQIFLGIILGLILMAAIYNGAMYYYNRDKSFLYYMFMQFFMLALLYDSTGAYFFDKDSFFARNIIYENLISLGTALFATLFNMHFLDAKHNMPKLYTYFKICITLIGLDMFSSLLDKSYIDEFNLYPFLMLPFLYAGFRRLRQGYKPAKFYLAGWSVLTLSVFLNVFNINSEDILIDPLFIGAAIEAVLLSLAISYKIRMIAAEEEQQKELLVHQSKLASMGEMIGNIAHQWRQPLTHLAYIFMNIKEAQKFHILNETYINKKLNDAELQLEFMSQTIDDFKDFYVPNKGKEHFSLSSATQETLEIIKNTLKHNDIEVTLIINEDSELYNYKNEYKQVLLNLISNAKDALIERVSINPKVIITINKNTITIEDNAGGIKKEILERIYEPYFTTKEGNSGIGLYMSKMIIERNMGGQLTVENKARGAKFSIALTSLH